MAEQVENKEGKNPEKIVLNAPEFLAVGQNFLDQEPFNLIIDKVVEENGIDPAIIKRILLSKEDSTQTFWQEFVSRHNKISASEWVQKGRRHYFRALTELQEKLEDFPYCIEYIKGQYVPGIYRADGDFNPHPSVKTIVTHLPRSYASWVSRKLRAEKNATLWGIQEIFPQDLTGKAPALRPEKGSGYRRWVILKASEIAPTSR